MNKIPFILLLLASSVPLSLAQSRFILGRSDAFTDGCQIVYSVADDGLICETPTSVGIPTGTVVITLTSCPTGWSEVATLDGKAVYGTLAAHGDVGGSIGSDTVTPTTSSIGLTAASQTVNSLTAAAQTFSGASTTVPALAVGTLVNAAESSHTHAVGTYVNGTSAVSGIVVDAHAAHTHTFTQSSNASTPDLLTSLGTGAAVAASGTTGNPSASLTHSVSNNGTAAAQTITGSSAVGSSHNHTISGSTATGTLTPLGSNATSAVTGTMNSSAVSGTITMNSLVPQFSGIKVIFCSKD